MTSHATPLRLPAKSTQASGLTGEILVPGDKSISHRSLMLSSQVLGTATIEGLLEGEDVLATAGGLRALGVKIDRHKDGQWQVQGVGIGGLAEPKQVIDMGNAGTGARLMMGLLAPYPFVTCFTGDMSLCSRPMKRVITPLAQMGARFMARQDQYLPLAMQGATSPLPITYTLPVASAQVKSAILLAGLNTPGKTTVIEKEPTRDHTERMLNYLGIEVASHVNEEGERVISVMGQQSTPFRNRHIRVPGDPSSAAFPVVAALICPGSDITIRNVCINAARTGLFVTLREMGASLDILNEREEAGEPIADLRVRYSALHGVEVPAERAPSMIDEYPILAIAAASAQGQTVMHGVGELRVKESDRLQAILDGLAANGVKAQAEGDTLTVYGMAGREIPGGGMVETRLDHRIAMSFLVLGMMTAAPVDIDDARAINTSFPGFAPLMNKLGANIHVTERRRSMIVQGGVPRRKSPPRIIAIDGPAASGKGTLARRLAQHYGYAYLDTGSLYRAVGLRLVKAKEDPHDRLLAIEAAKTISDYDMMDPDLRQEKVGKAASIVSAFPEVRDILLDYQRDYARRPEGAILDGRDIGTVVCPQADFKLFMTASLEARAKRRHKELQGQGIEVVYESVLEDLLERDKRDSKRKAAPLVPAPDAVELDTTRMSADTVYEKVLGLIEEISPAEALRSA